MIFMQMSLLAPLPRFVCFFLSYSLHLLGCTFKYESILLHFFYESILSQYAIESKLKLLSLYYSPSAGQYEDGS